MKDLPLGGSTTCRRESLEPYAIVSYVYNTIQAHIPSSKSERNLIILQVNINGIKNKLDELKLLIHDTHSDILTIQETKLTPKAKTPKVHNFTTVRNDRLHKAGGGVCCCCLPTPMTLASGGKSDVPACGTPARFSTSADTPVGYVHKSRGDNVVRMLVQLKR